MRTSANHWIHAALLSSILILIYSNAFQAGWHLDDNSNILLNPKIQIQDFRWPTLMGAITSVVSESINRPFARLTLAINWYFVQDRVFGYHLVNILIHCLATIILYHVVLLLFKTPNLNNMYPEQDQSIALLGALFWAIHPIQTQAVTYIIQRMTSLAALFYLLGMGLYLKGRLNGQRGNRFSYFLAAGVCFILSAGSKENGFLFPFTLILMEAAFFQDLMKPAVRRRLLWMTLAMGGVALFIGLFGLTIIADQNLLNAMFNEFPGRYFSPWQRLLTEFRVVFLYLSLILYPVPHRLSITHDMALSMTLIDPWTTLLALALIFIILGYSVRSLPHSPLISFAILFFFINHSLESTFLPLELIYEHRNYLPSAFIFVPIVGGVFSVYKKYGRTLLLKGVLIGVLPLFIIGLGMGTYLRNEIWRSEKSLWEDAALKAPKSARPFQLLAQYYDNKSQYEKAISLYEHSLSLEAQRPIFQTLLAYNNIGMIYLKLRRYNTAVQYFNESLNIEPLQPHALANRSSALIKKGEHIKALADSKRLLDQYPESLEFIIIRAVALIRNNDPRGALSVLRSALKINHTDPEVLMLCGVALNDLKCFSQANWFFRRAWRQRTTEPTILFHMLHNALQGNDLDAVNDVSEILLAGYSTRLLFMELARASRADSLVPVTGQSIRHHFQRLLENKLTSWAAYK